MQKLMLLCFSLIFILPSITRASEGFLSLESTLDKSNFQNAIEEASNSSFKLTSLSKDVCTGFFVSHSGYILTAAHCVYTCMKMQNLITEEFTSKYTVNKFSELKDSNPSCTFRVNNRSVRLKLISVGNGFANFDDRLVENFSPEVRETISKFKDFAILKLDRTADVSCLKISNNEPAIGEPLMAAGFPQSALRTVGSLKNKKSLHFSFGSVKSGLSHNGDYKSLNFSDSKIQLLEHLYNLKSNFISDIDLAHGSSGGPVLNQNGEVVGLVTEVAAFSSLSKNYIFDSAISIRISTILNEIEHQYGSEAVESIFDCK